ncbi:MAG: family 2 glycosyl transferase, partial [Clostridium sp.]
MSSVKYIKITIIFLIGMVLIGFYSYTSVFKGQGDLTHKELKVMAKTNDKEILLKNGNQFSPFFMKGVNIGAGKPGYFPNEFGITKKEYLKWFDKIANMNVNVIRVYTLLSPEFYEAIFEFNKDRETPLYIIHGVWVNENNIEDTMNGFNSKIRENFIRDIKSTINVIHGRGYVPLNNDYSNGRYAYDISPYVLGYILGIEWDGAFVQLTDMFNDKKTSYTGEYLYTKPGASPFETLLTEVGDFAIKYETDNYKEQKLIAFSNWPTTDPLEQLYEPEKYNTVSNIDVENIVATKNYKSGMFVSYHIYPYYPDFLNLDPILNGYKDEKGNKNSYRAYLNQINKHHSIPV